MTPFPSNKNASFQNLFFTGVVGWIAASIALFLSSWVLTKPESLVEALMWSVSYMWIAFACALVAIVVRGALTKQSLWLPVFAFVLPAIVSAGVVGICLAIYPNEGFRGDLVEGLPVVLVFYVFGFLWMRLRKADGFCFVRAVLPPIFGSLMILAFVAVPAFNSNAFRYRDAFRFHVLKIANEKSTDVAETVLEIRKPGHYRFTAPAFGIYDFGLDSAPEEGKITWGAAGEPKEGATGSFPLSIRWHKTNRPVEMPIAADSICPPMLEVRDAGAPETVIYTVVSQLPRDGK